MANKLLKENNYTPLTPDSKYLVQVNSLRTFYPIKAGVFSRIAGYVRAVDGVSFNIKKGQTMGLVGESGCGKTTVGRTLLRLTPHTDGEVYFNGESVFDKNREELNKIRPQMQIIFQDPYSSLSPRLPVGEIIGEAVREHKLVPEDKYDDYITSIMNSCGLQVYHKDRYPHEFSGGQRQRICIARALALNPKFVVCDEPVSALDVSIQSQIINLMMDLQEQMGLTYLFIAHDLSVVKHISNKIGVMYLGNIVEFSSKKDLFNNPSHPYTRALLAAIPEPNPNKRKTLEAIQGEIPSNVNVPSGCKFHTRCPFVKQECKENVPELREIEPDHFVACHFAGKV